MSATPFFDYGGDLALTSTRQPDGTVTAEIAQPLREFTDIRELQRQLKKSGVTMILEAEESTTGPASLMIVDPDGNTILFDQHV
jgi:hypothetical protein